MVQHLPLMVYSWCLFIKVLYVHMHTIKPCGTRNHKSWTNRFYYKICFNPAVAVVFDFVGMVHPLCSKIDVTQTL